jgi:hypothetical protein
MSHRSLHFDYFSSHGLRCLQEFQYGALHVPSGEQRYQLKTVKLLLQSRQVPRRTHLGWPLRRYQ